LPADAVGKRLVTVYGETEKEALANARGSICAVSHRLGAVFKTRYLDFARIHGGISDTKHVSPPS
jgi:hypothetical protein